MNQYYHPSGKYSTHSFGYFLLASVTLLPLSGIAYAHALYFFWKINIGTAGILIWFSFVFLNALAISSFVIRRGKVRNERLARRFGFAGALSFLYFHWAAYASMYDVHGLSYDFDFSGFFHMAFHPDELIAVMKQMNAEGTWELWSRTAGAVGPAEGPLLTILWLMEAFLTPFAMAASMPDSVNEPFSEATQEWHHVKQVRVEHIKNHSGLVASLRKGEEEVLHHLKRCHDASGSHTLLTLYFSELGEFYLNVEDFLCREVSNWHGKKSIDCRSQSLIKYIRIGDDTGRRLLKL